MIDETPVAEVLADELSSLFLMARLFCNLVCFCICDDGALDIQAALRTLQQNVNLASLLELHPFLLILLYGAGRRLGAASGQALLQQLCWIVPS